MAGEGIWEVIRQQVENVIASEPVMESFLKKVVLDRQSLSDSVAYNLATKFGNEHIPHDKIHTILSNAYNADEEIIAAIEEDIMAVYDRDPACTSYFAPLLFFKGFLSLQTYRAAHHLITNNQHGTALYLQSRASELFGADIHPSAKIGTGIMIDHATGVVIGETAVIGNDVSMLHGVTLGGSGKEGGDRHPKIGNGVLISVGAKVLGNIRVGDCAKIGGGSVVLTDVPAYSTVVGVPAKVIGKVSTPEPSREMDHNIGKDI